MLVTEDRYEWIECEPLTEEGRFWRNRVLQTSPGSMWSSFSFLDSPPVNLQVLHMIVIMPHCMTSMLSLLGCVWNLPN